MIRFHQTTKIKLELYFSSVLSLSQFGLSLVKLVYIIPKHIYLFKVKIYEVKVTKNIIIQQCGKANNPWTWWHELIFFFDVNEDMKLSNEEMNVLISTNKINLGFEFGANRGTTFPVHKGTNKYR